jgi:hypothetical protein
MSRINDGSKNYLAAVAKFARITFRCIFGAVFADIERNVACERARSTRRLISARYPDEAARFGPRSVAMHRRRCAS